jgi:hypothetical protein
MNFVLKVCICMSKFLPLAKISNAIRQHLVLDGTVRDQVGRQLIHNYAEAAFAIDEIQTLAKKYGMIQSDVDVILTASIENSMLGDEPSPCIKSGPFPMITGSLIFQEPFRLAELCEKIRCRVPTKVKPGEEEKIIAEEAVKMASEIWMAHTLARGEASFNVKKGAGGLSSAAPKGCLGIIFIGLVVGFGLTTTYFLS